MIDCVISDLGNVLITFDNAIFFRKMAGFTTLSPDEIERAVHRNRRLLRDFDMGRIQPDEFHRQALSLLDARLEKAAFFEIYNDVFGLKPRETRILNDLKSRCRMIMLSNTDISRYRFIRGRFPETQFFHDYVLSYEVGCIKPDPGIYRIALDRASASASKCVFIDDREENVAAARELGIATIHLTEEADLAEELARFSIPG